MINSPLQYQGPLKSNLTRVTGTSTIINPTDTYSLADTNAARVAVGFVYGVDHWAYNADGTPKTILGSVLIDNGIGYRFYVGTRGIAGYSVDQDAKSHARIVKALKVPTYFDSLYFDENHEYDWSES